MRLLTPHDGPIAHVFALTCLAWVAASLIVPALPIWDTIFIVAVGLSVLVSGGLWLAIGAWALCPVGATALAITRLVRGHSRSAMIWSAVPIAGVLIAAAPTAVGDIVKFTWNKTAYDRVVADAKAGKCSSGDRKRWDVAIDYLDCSDPVTIIFVWGGFVSSWHGIVYDASDEIAKLYDERPKAWRCREIGALLKYSGAKRPLGGHYYRAGGSYTSDPLDCG